MQITVQNHLGQQLVLDDHFKCIHVSGLTPAGAVINTAGAGMADGTFFNSSHVSQRNIVLTIVPEGNAEQGRLTLWKYFKPKYPCRLYFKTDSRSACIDGYVENIEGTPYENKARYQISVICPRPYFIGLAPAVYIQSVSGNGFTFPVSIPERGVTFGFIADTTRVNVENPGEERTGVLITLTAVGNVVDPTIYNITTREMFGVTMEMEQGDTIIVDTHRGQKSIRMWKNGEYVNIINDIVKGSTWFELQQGDNVFTYSCAYGDFNLSIEYKLYTLYQGV